MRDEITKKMLRSFGLLVGAIFAVIGFWPLLWRHQDPRWWSVILGTCLVVSGIVLPSILLWPYKGWMKLGHVLGWINTRIILGLVFYAVVTPIGVIRRWFGKDPMGRHLRPDLDTYRVTRKPRPASHLKSQF